LESVRTGEKAGSTIKLRVPPDVSIDLRVEAKRRGLERDALAAAIIAAEVNNDLFAAVLDR
jgi:hypothetical protein